MDRHTLKQLDSQVGELVRHGSPSCIRQANGIKIENFDPILRFALRLTEPKPKPKHTIADNYPAGGLTASEPCVFCVDFEKLQAEIERLRWIPADEPPEKIDWDKKVLVLECDSKIPTTMTMAEVFLDEGSEAEYWRPIILPEEALQGGGSD